MTDQAASSDMRRAAGVERTFIIDDEQWKALRRPDLTASNIATVVGVWHPYTTLAALYAEKKDGIELFKPDDVMLKRGRKFEKLCAEEVADEHPKWKIRKATEYFRDPVHRLGCTPDFFVDTDDGELAVLETKVVTPGVFKKRWTDELPPMYIVLQNALQVQLTDSDFGVVAALVLGDFQCELRTYRIPRNPGVEQRICEAADKFWHHIAIGEQPKFDHPRDAALIGLYWPREITGSVIDLSADNELPTMLDERETIVNQIKIAEERKATIDSKLREKMRDNEAAVVGWWRMTLKEVIKKAHAVKESRYRQLRVSRLQA